MSERIRRPHVEGSREVERITLMGHQVDWLVALLESLPVEISSTAKIIYGYDMADAVRARLLANRAK